MHVAWLRLKMDLGPQSMSAVLITSVLIQVFLLRRLYEALYASRVISGFPLHRLLIYLALSNTQAWVLQTPVSREIHHRVRQGTVAFDVMRPIGFVAQMAARQVGKTLVQLSSMAPAVTLLLAAGWLIGPAGNIALGEYAVSLFLAFTISLDVMLIVGMLAFWTAEAYSLELLVTLLGQFFAGALIPLSFFPPVLDHIAVALPFQGIGYLPVSIYIGRLQGAAALRALALQAGWSALLGMAAMALWSKALYRIVSQGG